MRFLIKYVSFGQKKLEQRDLTQEELDTIEDLTQMSKLGYNTVFARSYSPIRIGIYGICIHEGNILMVKTFAGDKYIYNFPGGGIEPHESLETCLKRECEEELGCEISIDKLLATSSRLYESSFFNTQQFSIYYAIKINGFIDKTLEGAQWFPINEIPYDMLLDIDKDFLKPYLQKK